MKGTLEKVSHNSLWLLCISSSKHPGHDHQHSQHGSLHAALATCRAVLGTKRARQRRHHLPLPCCRAWAWLGFGDFHLAAVAAVAAVAAAGGTIKHSQIIHDLLRRGDLAFKQCRSVFMALFWSLSGNRVRMRPVLDVRQQSFAYSYSFYRTL